VVEGGDTLGATWTFITTDSSSNSRNRNSSNQRSDLFPANLLLLLDLVLESYKESVKFVLNRRNKAWQIYHKLYLLNATILSRLRPKKVDENSYRVSCSWALSTKAFSTSTRCCCHWFHPLCVLFSLLLLGVAAISASECKTFRPPRTLITPTHIHTPPTHTHTQLKNSCCFRLWIF